MNQNFDGFYISYMTGRTGNTLALFVFSNGVIAGADMGGGIYDGKYSVDEGTSMAHLTITFVLPAGNSSITGKSADMEPIRIKVPLELPVPTPSDSIFELNTPLGPLNTRFERIRGING